MTTIWNKISGKVRGSHREQQYTSLNNDESPNNAAFGSKTIGYWGSISLLLSNLTGPALIAISLVYQNAGFLTPTICLAFVMILSTLAASFLCEAMSMLPRNHHFEGRVEFTTLVKFFFGRKQHILAQIFINVALQATNIASIIECSQVMDSFFVDIFGRSCGFEIYPKFSWVCVAGSTSSESPFQNAIMFFTVGYLVVLAVIIPLGFLNLDDNIVIQIAATMFLFIVIGDWMYVFANHGFSVGVPAFGPKWSDQSQVLGNILFNYSFVTTVPSWCNEKKPTVSANKTLWITTIIGTMIYFLVGYLGACSFYMPQDSDVLSVINSSKYVTTFTHVIAYIFPLVILGFSIPVFSIIVRYNLLQNEVCSKKWANFIAVVLPWLVVIPFMTGQGLQMVINWGSLFFGSIANFVIPFLIYVKARKFVENGGERNLTWEQTKMLNTIFPQHSFPTPSSTAYGTATINTEPLTHTLRNINININVAPHSQILVQKGKHRALPKRIWKLSIFVSITAAVLLCTMVFTVIAYDLILFVVYHDNVFG